MPVGDAALFARNLNGRKMHCMVCGAQGYEGGKWMEAHRRGHAPCAKGCGKYLTVLLNGKPRSHAKCPHFVRDPELEPVVALLVTAMNAAQKFIDACEKAKASARAL